MVRIIGHRGVAGVRAENSLAGFRHAVALGIDGVEFDVHQTRDGHLVVLHDFRIDRTTTGSGDIGDMTLNELQRFQLKDRLEETVPTLDDVLSMFARRSLELQVELKTDALGRDYPGMADRVMATLREHGLAETARLTSFVATSLERLRWHWPDQPILASINRASAQQMGGLEAAARRFHALGDCVLAIHTDLMIRHGGALVSMFGPDNLGVWAPDDQQELASWMASGLRQVTTDRPDIAQMLR